MHRAVFVNNGWRIADLSGTVPLDTDVVSQFLSAYVPLVRPLSHYYHVQGRPTSFSDSHSSCS